jgi:hypothetical protein
LFGSIAHGEFRAGKPRNIAAGGGELAGLVLCKEQDIPGEIFAESCNVVSPDAADLGG